MSLATNIDLRQSTHPRCFAIVVTVRLVAGLMWRVYPKRVSFGQEGSI